MRRTYWIHARPQVKEAHVYWLEGLRPVAMQPGHIERHNGPYVSAEQANRALASLYPTQAGYTLKPFEASNVVS
jgi:hypothetical protein